ncbi:MAG: ribonuclease III [Candidatus Marinimicrobia bacterium]|nr:ribonuclease III [Candidatus Neomarinimicrobiota bacterium]
MISFFTRLNFFFLSLITKPTELEQKVKYTFIDKSLLEVSLTHKSLKPNPKKNYERFEFLGDAVLDYVVSEWLFHKYGKDDEGKLTKKRAALVKKQFLAKMATKLNLVKYVKTNNSLDLKNQKVAYNLNGNIFESLVGAIFLDGGIKSAEKFIYKFLIMHENKATADDNYKGKLIEIYQEKGLEPPLFRVKNVEGPDHDKIFTIEAVVSDDKMFLGIGRSKKEAEQKASKNALESTKL